MPKTFNKNNNKQINHENPPCYSLDVTTIEKLIHSFLCKFFLYIAKKLNENLTT